MFEFSTQTGEVSAEQIGFVGGVIRFTFDRCTCVSNELAWKQRDGCAGATIDGLELSVQTDQRGLSARVRNSGKRAVRLMEIAIVFHPNRLPRALAAEDYMEFVQGPTFVGRWGSKRVGLANRWQGPNPASSMMYVLHHRTTRKAILFSTLPPHAGDFVTFRSLHDSPHMEGSFGVEIKSTLEMLIEPGKNVATSTIHCRDGGDAIELLHDCGEQWQKGIEKPLKPPCVGWNSWDYFAEAISSADVLENTRTARQIFNIAKPDILIDGGWDERWGRWEPSNLFPEGLEWLASEIKREGGVPGIWVAPTAVNVYTRLYRDHADWFVRDRSGKILEESYGHGQTVHLDVTHPEVQKWIGDLFLRLRGYGFAIFKVDFTQQQLDNAGVYHDPTIPRGGILRKLFEIIREAIGPESHLFTCGAPFESVTGLADSVRVSEDMHNHWSHILMCVNGMAARWWMNRRMWNCDPDFLIVRTAENCPGMPLNRPMNTRPLDHTSLWRSGREFNDREARTYALLILMAGAEVMLSDHLPALNEGGRDIIRRVLNARLTSAAVPVDLFDSHEGLPSIWIASEADHWMIGLFNWEEDPKDVRLDLAKHGVSPAKGMKSFWDDRPIESENGIVRAQLEPRACMGIRVEK